MNSPEKKMGWFNFTRFSGTVRRFAMQVFDVDDY